ncbi:XRE family transcriptional regulator [Streptomyces sp. t39]|uniref:XRE family transcriptional regulator n=1 Tax=Streptomyces sp. t39 TaxID=1828156 RepID=UPI0011CD3FF0|nr:XRE family transcriptional regulator [Streptomyces sp. t39]TXS35267.1 XRE family transcriptional regulator [Streptomyces sp. t39]
MDDKQVRPRQLATHLGVSLKTVERWLGNPDHVPHARTRADASDYLGVAEEMLWPKAVRTAVKTGPDREIVAVYPYRSACPSNVWAQLVDDAKKELFFAGYTNYFLFLDQPAFHLTLQRKLAEGVRVRFLLGDPEGVVTRQREDIEQSALSVSTRIRITLENLRKVERSEGLEVRYSAPQDAMNHVGLSVFRFDQDALVTPHLARLVGHDSPMMHLRHREQHGMFDRFADHAEELWSNGLAAG